ncbi:MAG: lipocalin family protein [Spirochaetes bacterium]|nr:lipocalin family protein [Spirochaetota bacterium]
MKKLLFLLMLTAAAGQADTGKKIIPVADFDLNRYLGKWYEIARFDHVFEKGLTKVTAEYSLMKNDKISVFNKGYAESSKKWKSVKGKAVFAGDRNEGHLRVSFFGPFYSDYIIFALDQKNYQYALVGGSNKKYLWILSRTPVLDDDILKQLLKTAEENGYDTDNLIFVKMN